MKTNSLQKYKSSTRDVRLYNVVFPVWLLVLFPLTWLVVLPLNFVIDSAVLLIALRCMGKESIRKLYQKSIVRVWLCGFAADFAGALLLSVVGFDWIAQFFPVGSALEQWWRANLSIPVLFNPFMSVPGFLYTLVAVLLSGVLIYVLGRKFAFARLDLPEDTKKKLALVLAIATAPYLFFLPMG